MKRISILAIALLVAISLLSPAQAQTYTVLHEFGGTDDGSVPYNRLTLIDSTLYGTTSSGAIFKIGEDGNGYQVLYKVGLRIDSSLTLVGADLYGTAYSGTSSNKIFKIGMDGSDFTVVHSFVSGEGAHPWGDLLLDGSSLYGVAHGVGFGIPPNGTVFKIGTDGNGMTILHPFTGGNDGSGPGLALAISGSTLYGVTARSGDHDGGTFFQVNTDGTGFSVLHAFAGGSTDGALPFGGPILSGSTFYGTTHEGGSSDKGTIYTMQTDGSGYALLHTFTGSDGSLPYATLLLDGSTLYGTTTHGGAYDMGTIFQVQTDGSGYEVLHSFTDADGSDPECGLIMDGAMLYGVTARGGTWHGGVLFSLLLPRDVRWTGEGNSIWSTAIGSGNWNLAGSGEVGEYAENSNVTFDDSATGSLAVILSNTDVAPASVVFNNANKDFIFTGTKGIVGATGLLKQGSGKVTISSVNSYTGKTTVEAGTLQLNGSAAYNPVLNLGGADIKGGTMIFSYAGQGDPSATINALLTASYNSGSATHFNTGQFQSSTAGADHALGWKTTMNYEVIVAYTLYGDATLNGAVDISDLSVLGQNWNQSGKVWSQGDFNYDGKVDISDLAYMGQNWNQSDVGHAAAIPEPSSLALLVGAGLMLGGLAAMRRRRVG